MVIPEELQDVLASDPDYFGGAVWFKHTRVPVQALLDVLVSKDSIDCFIEGFPDVSKNQAETVHRWSLNQSRKLVGLDLMTK